MNLRTMLVQEQVERGLLRIRQVATTNQLTEFMTK